MRGHEYIREAVRTYLEAAVPTRLAAHLAANGLTTPEPADVTFVLADGLQDITDFPVVVVRSTDATNDTWTADGTWSVLYDLEVIVACDHRTHGDYEGASKDRDRLLLAVREALYRITGLTEDIDIVPGKRSEQTGAASMSLAGVPLAAGTVKFIARVLETLDDLAPPEDVGAVDVSAAAFDASQTIP
jgi:hypothetical protein